MKVMKTFRGNYFGIAVMVSMLSNCTESIAQVDYRDFITSGEYDPYYKVSVRERLAVPFVNYREADIKFTRRVIRCIDVRQKMNKHIEWPKSALNEHLYTALWEGVLTPFRNDSLMSYYTTTDFRSMLSYEVNTVVNPDPEDIDVMIDTSYTVIMGAEKIRKFWIMEEWNFDANHSVFKPRIIALAPVFEREFATFKAPEQPLCWIRMDQATRDIMSRWELFNRYNDAARLNFDDLFQMRLFDSYIVFESNVFDNYINQFQEYENDKIGALLKAEEIKNDLFIFEHDLWQF